MMKTQIGGNVRTRVVWYYIAGASMPLLISLISFTSWVYEIEQKKAPENMFVPGAPVAPAVLVVAVGIVVIALVARHIHMASTTDIKLDDI